MKTLKQLHYEYLSAMYHEEAIYQRYGLNSPEYKKAKQEVYRTGDLYRAEKARTEKTEG